MNAGRTIAYLLLILLVSMACFVCAMCGILAGGVIGFMTGGAAGVAGGSGLRLPNQRWQLVQPQPFMPTPQVIPQVPRLQVTPQAPVPQRTPQPQRTPPAGRQTLPPTQSGALIEVVDPASPAEKAGLQVGDLIAGVDGAPVDQNHSLADLIQAHKPGDKVALSVQRKGNTLSVNVTLASRKLDSGQEVASLGVTYTLWAPAGPTN